MSPLSDYLCAHVIIINNTQFLHFLRYLFVLLKQTIYIYIYLKTVFAFGGEGGGLWVRMTKYDEVCLWVCMTKNDEGCIKCIAKGEVGG